MIIFNLDTIRDLKYFIIQGSIFIIQFIDYFIIHTNYFHYKLNIFSGTALAVGIWLLKIPSKEIILISLIGKRW
jgi:hypothetical protein